MTLELSYVEKTDDTFLILLLLVLIRFVNKAIYLHNITFRPLLCFN